ncbi:MAG: hypothetical protein H0W81_06660 [Chloroflexi bacterium]|nr:hypothetical protein [Chloroflexota bacterium]
MSLFPIITADESAVEEVSLPAFLVARDGLYLRKRSLLGLSQTRVDEVAHLPAAREYLEYALPKVPATLMAQAVGFFRAVWSRQKSEALALLTWDGESFGLVVPEQSAGMATVKHRLKLEDVPAGVRLIGSIHSHGALSAFASATDEADEADFDGIHVVVGDVDERRPSYSAAIVVDGRRFGCRTALVLQRPRRFSSPPAEWLERVKPIAVEPKKAKANGHARSNGKSRSSPTVPTWTWRDRTTLDRLLSEATELASQLGESLVYQLTPIATSAAKGGT